MKIAYISGPYSSDIDHHAILQNILTASKYAAKYWRLGYAVICPHKNTSGFEAITDILYETWIKGDLKLVEVSDVVVMLPGWAKSKGSVKEHDHAKKLGKEIIYEG